MDSETHKQSISSDTLGFVISSVMRTPIQISIKCSSVSDNSAGPRTTTKWLAKPQSAPLATSDKALFWEIHIGRMRLSWTLQGCKCGAAQGSKQLPLFKGYPADLQVSG